MGESVFDPNNSETAVGGIAVSGTPDMVEIFGALGLDFAFVDLEHDGRSPWDSEPVKDMARTAELAGIELVLRLPSGEPELVRKVLDTGVRNVLIPRVRTISEVKRTVEAAQFYTSEGTPGRRGIGSSRVWKWGRRSQEKDDLAREDDDVHVGVMLENERILNDLDDLVSLPGLDFVFVGPGDLSHALDRPMELDHPVVMDALGEIESKVADSSVTLGGVFAHDVDEMVDRGYQLIVLGSDYSAVYQQFDAKLADFDSGANGQG